MLRLYMDVHVKAAITAEVRRRGIDVVTAQEDGATRLHDGRSPPLGSHTGRLLGAPSQHLMQKDFAY